MTVARTLQFTVMIALATVILTLGLASIAKADRKISKGWAYRNENGLCTWVRSDLRHGNGGGASYAFVRSRRPYFYAWGTSVPCQKNFSRSAGDIAVKYERYKWTSNGWRICTYTGWRNNTYRTYYWSVYGAAPNRYASCGRGYYGTTGYGYVYNGGWKGGTEWSGYHYLPAS